MNATGTHRSRQRGAAMVEALCVISVMVIFFVGMTYFRMLYQEKLRIQRLARAAAVAYAMDACPDGQALSSIQIDLGPAKDNVSGSAAQPATTNMQPDAKVGNSSAAGNPVGKAMDSQGFALDKIAGISLQAVASNKMGSPSTTPGEKAWFTRTVQSHSFMSCGDVQKDGDIGGAIDFVKGAFKW